LTDGQKSLQKRRTLNPRFVEWLMGWPTGWTAFEPLETASYLSKQRLLLRYLLNG
jgi:hypothetical protein